MLLVICEKVTQGRVEEKRFHHTAALSKELFDLTSLHLNDLLRFGICVLARHICVSGDDDTSEDRQGQRDGSSNKYDQLLLNIQIHALSPPFALFTPSIQVYLMG